MVQWQEIGAGRIGNTAKPIDAPVGHFRPTLRTRRIFPSGSSNALPDASHRAAPFSCRSEQIRQRHGHAVYLNRP
ncbi:MAG: hypothetical protein ACFE0S_11590 [Rhodospirillales bacterium]